MLEFCNWPQRTIFTCPLLPLTCRTHFHFQTEPFHTEEEFMLNLPDLTLKAPIKTLTFHWMWSNTSWAGCANVSSLRMSEHVPDISYKISRDKEAVSCHVTAAAHKNHWHWANEAPTEAEQMKCDNRYFLETKSLWCVRNNAREESKGGSLIDLAYQVKAAPCCLCQERMRHRPIKISNKSVMDGDSTRCDHRGEQCAAGL